MFPDQQNQNPGGQAPQQQPIYGTNAGTPQQTYDSVPPPSITGHPTGHNPYEFIVNPNKPGPRLGSLGDPFIRKIVVVVGGGIALIAVIAVGISLLKPTSTLVPQLTTIAAEQQEIVRVATAGIQASNDLATQNLAANAETSVATNQIQVVNYIVTRGTKLDSKELGAKHSATTDQTLAAAQTTNTYDTALRQTLTTQLTAYNASLAKAYRSNPGPKLKVILQNSYNACSQLLKQAQAITSATS